MLHLKSCSIFFRILSNEGKSLTNEIKKMKSMKNNLLLLILLCTASAFAQQTESKIPEVESIA